VKKILEYLTTDGSFLLEEIPLRIRDSYYDRKTGHGFLRLVDRYFQMSINLDRGLEMEISVGPTQVKGEPDGALLYSVDIIKQLMTGEVDGVAWRFPASAEFLRGQLQSIACRFDPPELESTVALCDQYKRDRAKRLFGFDSDA